MNATYTPPALYAQINAIDLSSVPVMSRDRMIERKEQARLARDLFRRLGLRGISVTAPNYSMAQSVHVRVPNSPHPGFAGFEQFEHDTYSTMPAEVPAKQHMRAHYAASEQLEKILEAAFPQHDNRSDYQTDHFDYCWSIN